MFLTFSELSEMLTQVMLFEMDFYFFAMNKILEALNVFLCRMQIKLFSWKVFFQPHISGPGVTFHA